MGWDNKDPGLFFWKQFETLKDKKKLFVVSDTDCNIVSISPRTHQVFYMFGFLFVAVLLLLLSVIATSVILCHNSLRYEVRKGKEKKSG